MSKLFQHTELRQTLKITTSMQQSIAMLQMSGLELNNYAIQELAKNPFLEDNTVYEEPTQQDSIAKNTDYNDNKQQRDSEFDFLSNIAAEKTLREYILEQINIEVNNPKERIIAYHLLDSLQPSGYIVFDIAALAQTLKCKISLIDEVLYKLQKFDPPGIFARNLKECLKLQLDEQDDDNNKALILIDNLELLAKGEIKQLEKICDVDNYTLHKLIAKIKKLNPKPGNGFNTEQIIYRTPDVILTFDENGLPQIEINLESMPKLRLNHELSLKIKLDINNESDKLFTKQELNSATSILRAIEMRAKTILKVAAAVVAEQINFFNKGVMYFKPLTLAMIAEITSLNESTISRSIANKYISTPEGIYELKYFFSSALSGTKTTGTTVSSTKVKELIKQIINSENQECILSDDEIAAELQKFNIKIARRTVAKYRESMELPTSAIRKKQFNN
ncbi:RNA polymerase factor sigma-54 [Candidatus Trichorickettsia mobilis]|uniref:RNA polymerase factor sigma-54 n=1 Tax=Candidatus Trichorickettsia mobilis TaxID=1346319 RepID=UPI002930E837|nr:RNA polymerase factor sigma-54 [Candidatus Trichorickettsia mobilis]